MWMKPRSSLALVFSRPIFSVRGRRPTAIKNFFGADGLRFSGFVFVNDRRAVCVFLHGLDFGFEFNFHALLHQGFVQFGGNFLVFERNDARERFEERDLGAERVEDGGELDAYSAAAHYDHGFRDLLQAENFAVG